MHFWSAQLTRRPLLSILLFFALINLWLTSILYSRYGSTRYSFFFGKRSDDLAKLSVNHLESLKRSQMMFKELMENHTLIDQAAVDRQLIYNALLDYNEMLFVDVTDEDRTSWRGLFAKSDWFYFVVLTYYLSYLCSSVNIFVFLSKILFYFLFLLFYRNTRKNEKKIGKYW